MLWKVTHCTGRVSVNYQDDQSTAMEWSGDGELYLMNKMQLGGWIWQVETLVASLSAAVL